MQVRAFKLPPLPGKKNPPIQIVNRINRIFDQEQQIPYSISRKQIQLDEKQNSRQLSRQNKLVRPSSVRSFSKQSLHSRESRENSREKSIQLFNDKINHNLKVRVSMPSVTAKSWAVYEMKQSKLIYGKRMFKKRQIASLTKIMNLITIIELLHEYNLQASKIYVKISRQASLMTGTTAEIKQNFQLSLYDLYFGLMLPSGNDAAQQIAQIGGSLLLMNKNGGEINKQIVYDVTSFSQYAKKQNAVSVHMYLAQMNKLSKKIQMRNTHFANPHGLSNPDNYSCAQDLCKLCTYCMENDKFRHIIRTQNYTAQYSHTTIVRSQKISEGNAQKIEYCEVSKTIRQFLRWQNTNKMLKQGWSGIKTGITPNAGPCLAASVEKHLNGRSFQFLVILINSVSMEARWRQVRQIVEWIISQKLYI